MTQIEKKECIEKVKQLYSSDIDTCILEEELNLFVIFLKENRSSEKETKDEQQDSNANLDIVNLYRISIQGNVLYISQYRNNFENFVDSSNI